ncbi:alpha,alpha-trehalose-phosphate synthase (UDP-forming) [Roseococcus microcysteis]|uniref:alpha,alpha-trehalose-phosphate synthase (UDP-forming) n=1 Tax=Roseococcus microcysteis TaxID=2771361 RepID=UPI00168A6A82|nr:trehalose-6-phosphate synthase [Roseococcus microcysteis]
MARLVIVSNRVPPLRATSAVAGGLAVALEEAVRRREMLWFGWSGETSASTEPKVTSRGQRTQAVIDLTAQEHRLYYGGYCNGTLWPLLHYRFGLAEFRREEEEAWRAVNDRFAEALWPLLREDDVIWVHDFHLFPLAAKLRAMGAKQRIGFFLHVPFPPPGLFAALPRGEALLRDLDGYDLIGMQTPDDAENLRDALRQQGVNTPVGAYPVGIDAEAFGKAAEKAEARRDVQRFQESLSGRRLIFGVDRLDYTKGLPQRLEGYADLLKRFPQHRGKITFLQVAPVSRGEVKHYRLLRRELDEAVGRINGEFAEVDWVPLRWTTRPIQRSVLAGFLRIARVALVTPLRDGMNLVAKEFVSAQPPEDPGVLVLSRFAGAAREMHGALLVNPNDPDEIAEALDQALSMPLSERRQRWRQDYDLLQEAGSSTWSRDFLTDLTAARAER